MIKIAICDDENKFVVELETLIRQYSEELGIAICTVTYSDGAELTQNYPMDIDLIFLDIQMANVCGLQAADTIRKMDAKVSIIFLTSMAQYALEGYKYNAANFIIKPIKYVRLKAELDRWLSHFTQEEKEYILISNNAGKHKVFLNMLQYIETSNRNLMVHTEGESLIDYRKMKDLESELPEAAFVRCHSGYLVNLFFVKRIEKLEIELTTGEKIPVSQPKRKYVMARLASYWGNQL